MVQVTSWSLAFFCEEDTNFCLGSLLRFWFKLIWFQDWHKCWNILEQFETPNGSCFCAHAIHNASLLRRSDKGQRFLLAQTPKHGDEMQPSGTKLLMSETSWNYAEPEWNQSHNAYRHTTFLVAFLKTFWFCFYPPIESIISWDFHILPDSINSSCFRAFLTHGLSWPRWWYVAWGAPQSFGADVDDGTLKAYKLDGAYERIWMDAIWCDDGHQNHIWIWYEDTSMWWGRSDNRGWWWIRM